MFDVGFPELFIVAVLAIVVVGPKDLPKVIRSVMGMIRKVRDMGGEFQAGVKKMADEVELDAVTRKLNESGNVDIDDKPENTTSAASDYDEFDYDEYDYEGHNYEPPAPNEKSGDGEDSTSASDNKDEVLEEVATNDERSEVEEKNTSAEADDKIKSKTDD